MKVDPTGALAFGVEVDPRRGMADSGRFADDLADLFEVLGETARAAAVLDIATILGKPHTSDISVARNELIKKGLVYAPERTLLALTVPGMSDLIERQA